MRSLGSARALALPSVAFPQVPVTPLSIGLVALLLASVASVVGTMEIGSGDYGQWLMTSRPYLGLDVPAYRADSTVAPLVPAALAVLQALTGDPFSALRLLLAMLVVGLGSAAAFAAATFFRKPAAALLGAACCLVLSDRFMDLFAFGGLLQLASMAFMFAAVAAFQRAPDSGRAWLWWIVGALFTGLGALSHVGTTAILVSATAAVAGISLLRMEAPWRSRLARVAPLVIVLAAVGTYLAAVLLPGTADLAANPASLHYRGPDRLLGSLTDQVPTFVIVVVALLATVGGTVAELRRRQLERWTPLLAWIAVSFGVAAAAVAGGVATDYPRFATPILAPLLIATAGAGALVLDAVVDRFAPPTAEGRRRSIALLLSAAVVGLAAPTAVIRFGEDVAGYRVADMNGLRQAAVWIDEHVAADRTVLAAPREGKWIEGLTGRAALFSNPVRYSFRPAEWQRSLAADTLLRANAVLVNEFFFVRFADGDANAQAPRQLSIAANHGGEFVELLNTVPAETVILDPDGAVLASLPHMQPVTRREANAPDELSVSLGWTADRRQQPVELRQTTVVRRDASTLELRAGVGSALPVGGFRFDLKPALPLVSVNDDGAVVEATFASLGASAAKLRLIVARGDASITTLPDGQGLRISVLGNEVRLLITALTAADSPHLGLQALVPAELVESYSVGAALLRVDPSFGARRDRLAVLGFQEAAAFGSYLVFVRP